MATKPFVSGHSYKMLLIMFVIGCLLGTFWEELLYHFEHGGWVSRTGTVIGPFSPIYGFGIMVFALILGPGFESRSILKTYLISCLIGGVAEFVMSWIAEVIFHEVIWDYSEFPLNILGRTSIPHMLGWGLGGLALMKLVYPLLIKLFSKVPNNIGMPIWIVLLVFMIVNLFLTYGSLGRQAMRQNGEPPHTFIGEFFDKVYPDEWLAQRFPAIGFNDEAKDTAKPGAKLEK